jgi:NADH:ubiquinone oxidoreductase subunit E
MCFGSCVAAPMMWVDDDFHEDLDLDRAVEILAALD